ncbi:molecular chaperone [Pseudomonas sp. NPDC087697]|uniref:fimbrial biogenesis chaperone n=1 Tax=Pseudomonas sp. NPDC087697 TaxID=3364447 RepID=UPI0038201B4A
MTRLKKIALAVSLLIGATVASESFASVVMTGTRVIYPASAREKAIQLTNHDTHPYLVQLWLDKGNKHSTAQTADAPFVASPQIFRINANSGQVVRLIYSGDNLPTDRESAFYLNFVQMPAMKASEQEANKLLLIISSRLKVFYRPNDLAGNPDALSDSLTLTLQGLDIVVSNDSGYFATVRDAAIVSPGKVRTLTKDVMIAPKSKARWAITRDIRPVSGDIVRLTLVNDFGADVSTDMPLH